MAREKKKSILSYYILLDPDKPNKSKVGISTNLTQRLRAYRTAAPQAKFFETYVLPDKMHEKKILELLKERFTVMSEYVHCPPSIVKNIVEGYFDDNDITY
jgi:hypothetical protein